MKRLCPSCNRTIENPPGPYCSRCGTELLTIPITSDLTGSLLDDRYQIIKKIGSGGIGIVYSALQLSVQREVAVKVMKPDMARRPDLVKRFSIEARATCTLTNPHTVTIHDFNQTVDGTLYLVMELISGEGLHILIERSGTLPWQDAVTIAAQVCSSLAEAHFRGIIHRDLKPENIMLADVGSGDLFVKLMDFGIAKVLGKQLKVTFQTATGVVVGTPTYLSPEVIQGEQAVPGSDMYALGIILYEMLSGAPPFYGKTPFEILTKHIIAEPRPLFKSLSQPDFPPALQELIFQLLEKDPTVRPGDARAIRARLLSLLPK